MNTPTQTTQLVEAMTTAHRQRDPRSLRFHPAFYDLDATGREAAYRATLEQRQLEAALDPDGLSTTARLILDRLNG